MDRNASQDQIDGVLKFIRDLGCEPILLPSENRMGIGVPQELDNDTRQLLESGLAQLSGVHRVSPTSTPYKLVSFDFHPSPTIVEVNKNSIGPGTFTMMAGPCSVESYEQYRESADWVKKCGATILRGGAFKPRTSPYSFQGLQDEGLKIIKQVGLETGLTTITEVMSAEMVEAVSEHVDILQIGARNMQNFPLLIEAGASKKPVFLKRGPSSTIDEFLLAAEYVVSQGNERVILCERGILPFDRTYTRNTLDLTAVPVLKAHTHLPVVVDPSHGTGVARYVSPMAKAALVAGADGVMVEMHPNPKSAKSDAGQALDFATFAQLMDDVRSLCQYMDLRLNAL